MRRLVPAWAAVVVGLFGAVGARAQAPVRAPPTVLARVASEDTAAAVAARHGLTLVRAFPWIGWYELATPRGTRDAAAAQSQLRDDPDVRATDAVAADEQISWAVEPRSLVPHDPAWTAGNLPSGEPVAWYLTHADLPAAWDRSTGAGASIGIVDSEFDTTHPDLAAKFRNPYNTASGTAAYHTADVRAADDEPPAVLHGTHVAGIAAAATANGVGISGAGFDATFVPVRVTPDWVTGERHPADGNVLADLTEALGYLADQGVAVVNLSLATTTAHQTIQDAIAALRAKGITVVAAGGNLQLEDPGVPIYPAAYDGVIAVANTRADDSINPSSSNGAWIDLAAPGTDVFSTWDARDPQYSIGFTPGNYAILSGTSMAAPVVAGTVALMKAVRPELTPDQIESLLKSTARDLGPAGPDPQFGAGLVDAGAAVAAAIALGQPPPAPPTTTTPSSPPPTGGSTTPPADTVAPRVTLSGPVTVAGRDVTVHFKCDEACTGTARVRSLGRRVLARRTFSAAAGRTAAVRLRLPRLLRASTLVIVEVAAKDAAGNLTTQSQRRRLHRATRRRS